jgi:AcrR family transcriptional regulator
MSNKKAESLRRVVEIAIQAFSRLDYDRVLIGDIAAEARCSTATVYDAFGTKEQLYEHVRARIFERRPRQAPLEPSTDEPTLSYLIDYLLEVFEALTGPTITLLTTPASAGRPSGYRPWEHTGLDFDTVVAEVSSCMGGGLLRRGDPHAFAFLMFAGISYEPMLYTWMCKEPTVLDPVAILQSIFDPLV